MSDEIVGVLKCIVLHWNIKAYTPGKITRKVIGAFFIREEMWVVTVGSKPFISEEIWSVVIVGIV